MSGAVANRKILLLGASGMVGHQAWRIFRERFDEVFATVRKPRAHYAGIPLFDSADPKRLIDGMDLLEPTRVLPVLDDIKPDVIFNCVGLTFRRSDSLNAEAHIRVNALLPHVLNRWCTENSAKFISLSTDCVFSGREGGYTEESVTDAKDAYGRSKALGEVESPHALILRTSVVGREVEYKTELLEWFLAHEGKSVKGFTNAIYSGVGTNFIAHTVADLIEKFPRLSGIYQVASEPLSKHDLLVKMREVFGVKIEIVPDGSFVSKKNLVGTKFERATGIKTPSWDEMLRQIKNGR